MGVAIRGVTLKLYRNAAREEASFNGGAGTQEAWENAMMTHIKACDAILAGRMGEGGGSSSAAPALWRRNRRGHQAGEITK